jgi:hypothetical protein
MNQILTTLAKMETLDRIQHHVHKLVNALADGCTLGLDTRRAVAETLGQVADQDMTHLLPSGTIVVELPKKAQPKPSMSREQYLKSWTEKPDHAGIAELKEMSEQPARLPEGVFVMRGSQEEIQAQVASLLGGIFGKQPPAAH